MTKRESEGISIEYAIKRVENVTHKKWVGMHLQGKGKSRRKKCSYEGTLPYHVVLKKGRDDGFVRTSVALR